MRVHSSLTLSLIALLYPLHTHALTAQKQLPSFHYTAPDIPANLTRSPSTPSLFDLGRTPPRLAPPPASGLDIDPNWQVDEVTFDGNTTPVSANVLRTPSKAAREFGRAVKAIKLQDLQKAEQHLQKALEIYPEYSDAYHNLGLVALLRGDNARGEALIERALEFDGHNLHALMALARVRVVRGDPAAAQRYMQRFLTIAPENVDGLLMLAIAQTHQGRRDDALLTFARLDRREHGGRPEFHLVAGSLYEAKGNLPRAIAEFKQYLREAPSATNREAVTAVVVKLENHMARNQVATGQK